MRAFSSSLAWASRVKRFVKITLTAIQVHIKARSSCIAASLSLVYVFARKESFRAYILYLALDRIFRIRTTNRSAIHPLTHPPFHTHIHTHAHKCIHIYIYISRTITIVFVSLLFSTSHTPSWAHYRSILFRIQVCDTSFFEDFDAWSVCTGSHVKKEWYTWLWMYDTRRCNNYTRIRKSKSHLRIV